MGSVSANDLLAVLGENAALSTLGQPSKLEKFANFQMEL
jgi:hypothetical protein